MISALCVGAVFFWGCTWFVRRVRQEYRVSVNRSKAWEQPTPWALDINYESESDL